MSKGEVKTIRWGLIGCGSVAEYKGGPALLNVANSELVAVMSRTEDKAKSFAERHHVKRYYSSVEDVLSDSEIDAVYIATPPNVHADLTIKAAKAGKHVLCEKPMAVNVKQCEDMIKACTDNGVQLMIAYYRRHFPVVRKIKELLDTETIGNPVFARVEVSGFYTPPEHGSVPWRADPKTGGGGWLVDIGSHRIDLLVHLLGDVKDVSAFTDTICFDFDVEDTASLIMRFKNDMHGMVSANWNIGTHVDEFEIGGTKGRILSPNLDKGELKLFNKNEVEEYNLPSPQITHLGIVDNFVKSVLSGKKNCLPGEEGIKTTKIIEAAYQSSKERKVIEI